MLVASSGSSRPYPPQKVRVVTDILLCTAVLVKSSSITFCSYQQKKEVLRGRTHEHHLRVCNAKLKCNQEEGGGKNAYMYVWMYGKITNKQSFE